MGPKSKVRCPYKDKEEGSLKLSHVGEKTTRGQRQRLGERSC